MNRNPVELQVLADAASLAAAAAERFVQLAKEVSLENGRFCVALSGGSTPRTMFQQLTRSAGAKSLDWTRMHVFWGDERCVPADHPDSNYKMTRLNLLDFVPIPLQNIHRIPAEVGAEAAAQAYEQTLQRFFGGENLPGFDLVLLGLGEDGHTASLFPGSPAVDERERWVAAVEHTVPPPPLVSRITLTLPVINAAARVWFLVSGGNKAGMLKRILQPSDALEADLPARLVQPVDGLVTWLVDRDAAGLLDQK